MILIVFFILIRFESFSQKNITVYHDTSGKSGIIDLDLRVLVGEKYTVYAKKGESVCIEVLNSHPGLCKYEFERKEVKETTQTANIPITLSSFLSVPDLVQINTKAKEDPMGARIDDWIITYYNDIKS